MSNSGRPIEPGAIVLGGDVGALGIVRSLGRRNIPVWIVVDGPTVAGLSRYCRKVLRWPALEESRRVDFLLGLGDQFLLDNWVLYAIGDESAAMLARHHSALTPRFHVPTPPWDILRWAYDKRLTLQLAEQLNIPCPRTFYPSNRSEVQALKCDFPVILKPAHKHSVSRFTHDKAWPARGPEELLARYDEAATLLDPGLIMIQEIIPGGGESQFSCAGLYQNGNPLASITARRVRQYPVDFGWCSTLVESISAEELETTSALLLRAMHYTGLAEVEFKHDVRDGKYKLLEVNPRIWWWHSLAVRAGIDLPYMVWCLARSQPVDQLRARPGEKWVRMARDLSAAAVEIGHGRLSVSGYLRSLKGVSEFAVMAKDDPLPGLLEPLLWLALKVPDLRWVRDRRRDDSSTAQYEGKH